MGGTAMRKMKKICLVVGCLATLLGSEANADILGYPWSTWGDVSYSPGGATDKGAIATVSAEQGIDWLHLGESGWVFNTCAGIGLSTSDHAEEYWNNKAKPAVGAKIKKSFDSGVEVNLGLRGEYADYFNNRGADELRGVAFIQWSASGNWKNK